MNETTRQKIDWTKFPGIDDDARLYSKGNENYVVFYDGSAWKIDKLTHLERGVLFPTEPHVVPWTRESCPVGAVVRLPKDQHRFLITFAGDGGVRLSAYDDIASYQQLANDYVMDADDPQGRWKAGDPAGTFVTE